MSTAILKPGILVSAKSTVSGGVHYTRQDLAAPQNGVTAPAREVARWETTRTIDDAKEHERAVKARSAAVALIRRQCVATSFGLLCPTANEDALSEAIVQARDIADRFNREAAHSTISVYVLKGRIAETDEEATRALASEIRSLLEEMSEGIFNLNAGDIREAANKARSIGQLLDDEQAEKVGKAITEARTAARAIVKRVEKDGEDGVAVMRDLKVEAITSARFAFLDSYINARAGVDSEEPEQQQLPAVDPQRFTDLATDEFPPLRRNEAGSTDDTTTTDKGEAGANDAV